MNPRSLYSGLVLIFILFINLSGLSQNLKTKIVAEKPPMGWNSWNSYGIEVTETQIKAAADYMEINLKKYGWEYVVVDMLWYGDDKTLSNTNYYKTYKPKQKIDDYGRVLPAEFKYPSSKGGAGFKPLADYVHSKGFKFGVHIMRGIPWQAVDQNLPVYGTKYHARDIVNNEDTCQWYNGMRGINMTKPGAQEYYNSLINLFAQWGVDYIKADDMAAPYHTDEIAGLSKAIKNCERPIVLSLSPGAAPVYSAKHLNENANMWRISSDFWDKWPFLLKQFTYCRSWQSYATPGHWPDCDMLPIGKLRKKGCDDYALKHFNLPVEELTDNYSRFTDDEKYTMMTLFSIFRSPLMIGGYLPENDETSLKLLTNAEVIAVNQNSTNNRELYARNGQIVWTADIPSSGAKYLALFNTNDSLAQKVVVKWEEMGIKGRYMVHDLWEKKDIGIESDEINALVSPHGTKLYKLISEPTKN